MGTTIAVCALDQRNANEDDADFRVYNLGIPGETSDELLKRFNGETAARVRNSRCVILLAMGINDARHLHDVSRQQTPIDQFERNMRQIIVQARMLSADVVILGLTRVDEQRTTPLQSDLNRSYRNADIEQYDRALETLCVDVDIGYVNLESIGWTESLLEDDGLHPNGDGHARIFDRVRDALVERGYLGNLQH